MVPLAELLGESPGMVALRETVTRLLRVASNSGRLPPVFIEGETGTGKTALAHAMHGASARRNGPFVAVNSSTITDTLAEAQLFGHEKGAYTDAREARPGLFQQAHTGTIFLDEIALMPLNLQPKLLKVLEDKQVRRVGGSRVETVDVWVIAASNADMTLARRERQFREDLYQRLALVTLRMPPLRERERDVVLLAEHFLARTCRDYQLSPRRLDAGARNAVLAYRWPGNVRELANVMERTALLSAEGVITAEMLALRDERADGAASGRRQDRSASLDDEVESMERTRILAALEQTKWNISRAAAILGLSRNKLRYRIDALELRRDAQPLRRTRASTAKPEPPPAPALPVTTSIASLRWERRRLTLLRAEIVNPRQDGSPVDATRLVALLVDKVHGFGGRVEELTPASIVSVFGLEPVEDAPRRAALTAMAMLKAVETSRAEGGAEFGIKIAIHLDRLRVGTLGSLLQLEGEGRREGWATLAAMTTTGEIGAIRVSRTAAPFLERRFELAPASDTSPGTALRLVGREYTGLGPRGRITPLVGRHAEMQLLHDRLDAAVSGQGQAVGIAGEPGIGKSHLLHEFHQRLADRDVTYLEGRCFAYATTTPYWPVLELLRSTFRVGEADSPTSVANKVRQGLEQIGMLPDDAAPYILHLLGFQEGAGPLAALSSDAIRTRTFETVSELTMRGSRSRPLVLAVEDLHWIDDASNTFLAALLESLAGAPLLLLMTYRPGYRPPGADKSYFTQMSLRPLSRADSLKVVKTVLETDEIAEPLVRAILNRAEGNPFFLEELARVVGEQPENPVGAVPETLEEVLLARIDRLPEDRKRLLQTASVLGREFSVRLLREICTPPADLDSQLRDLARLEFLFTRSAAREPLYSFKHALVHQVAYETCPPSERRGLHAAAGRALETLHADHLEEVYDALAHHYSRTEDEEKAIDYLSRFATKAGRSSAHVEAVAALREALGHAERLADGDARERRRLGLVLQQVHSLALLGSFQETRVLLLGERERVERLRDSAVTGPYYFWLGRTYGVLGDHERARESAQRALAEAMHCDDRATMGKAYYALAYEDYWSGQARSGVELARHAARLLDETAERFWLGLAHWVIAINYAHIGECAPALEAAAHVQAIGDAMGDPGLRCTAAWTRGMVCAVQGQYEAAIAACELALESSPNPVNTALAMGFLGASHLERGDAARAIPLLDESARQLGQFQVPTQGWFLALLGEAHFLTGRLDRAAEFAEQGVRICTDVRYRYGLGWAVRALGRIALARGALAEAESYLTRALDSFVSIEARAEGARTHVALAELARGQRDRDKVIRHLTEAHRIFAGLALPKHTERLEALAREWEVGPI